MKTIVDQILTIYDMLIAEPTGVAHETLRAHAGSDYDRAIIIMERVGLVKIYDERVVIASKFRP